MTKIPGPFANTLAIVNSWRTGAIWISPTELLEGILESHGRPAYTRVCKEALNALRALLI